MAEVLKGSTSCFSLFLVNSSIGLPTILQVQLILNKCEFIPEPRPRGHTGHQPKPSTLCCEINSLPKVRVLWWCINPSGGIRVDRVSRGMSKGNSPVTEYLAHWRQILSPSIMQLEAGWFALSMVPYWSLGWFFPEGKWAHGHGRNQGSLNKLEAWPALPLRCPS